jgi:hypothetical protein
VTSAGNCTVDIIELGAINFTPKGYACNETNLMHYLSLVYSVTIPLHVSGLLVAHHQEVTNGKCCTF